MKLNDQIRQARLNLDYDETALAKRVGLTIYELGDVEARPDEFLRAITSHSAINLCRQLRLSPSDLLEITESSQAIARDVAEHVHLARQQARLTGTQLDELLGYESGFVEKIESGTVDLKQYPLELALDIADQTHTPRAAMLHALEREVDHE